jgi:LmbE family N-acetylglucosaminyl deacetylase
MKILVVGAHPDDEVLGCGATTARLEKEGHEVDYLILSGGRGDEMDNQFDKETLLYWVTMVEIRIMGTVPDIIFTHYKHDLNIDHRITYQAVITACRPIKSGKLIKEIYSFEVLSNTEWNISGFVPDTYYNIGAYIHKKIAKMNSLYGSEMRRHPHPRSIMGIRYLALHRGYQCGCEYAEAFKTVRRRL